MISLIQAAGFAFALILAGALPGLAQPAPPALDKAAIEAIVREYIVKNPEIIQEALVELERRQKEAELAAIQKITSDPMSLLYVSDAHTVVGNPDGDVTIVEFSDYNCPYCKRGLVDLQKLVETDKKLKVILKELPILSPGSREAAVVSLALRKQFDREKLWKFHIALMNVRGQIGKEQAMGVAKEMGADLKKLEIEMNAPAISEALEETKVIAEALGITGTPSYVVAGELVVGARGFDALNTRVAAWRQCKKAMC